MPRRIGPAGLALAMISCGQPYTAHGQDESKLRSYGRHLAQECTGCHRLDGLDNGIPPIVGWNSEDFTKALDLYRTGARTNPVMVSVVQSLDTEQVRALADYYASLPKPVPRN
jgi:cytochrome c553